MMQVLLRPSHLGLVIVPPMQQVTMAQIAEKAGVDQSTVSLSLRNSPRISAATRQRVQQAAHEMGYRPNPFVSALMRTRRKRSPQQGMPVVAWVSTWSKADTWMHVPIFKAFFDGAEERLKEHGFRLEHFWFDRNTLSTARFSSILWTRGITGVMIAPVPNDHPDVSMEWEKFSAVTIGRSLRSPQLDRVDSAHYDAISMAIHHCHGLGYKRIGLAIEDVNLARFERRWQASYLVNSPSDQSPQPLEAFCETVTTAAGLKAFQAWFRRNRPDVIITLSKEDGDHFRDALAKLKLSIPQDVGLVILSCPSLSDPYSGVYQFPQLMGAQAAEILIRKILLNEYGLSEHPLTFSLNGSWNAGTTVRPMTPAEPKKMRRKAKLAAAH